MRVLFAAREFSRGIPWTGLSDLIPGWDIATTRPRLLADSLDGADVLTPFGVPISAEIVERGRFGLIQQYGVGVENIAVDTATEAGVWVCRLPSHLTANAESVAELAVLHVLAGMRRLDEARATLRERDGWNGPAGRSLLGATTAVVGLGAIGTAVTARLAGFGTRLVGVRARPDKGGPPEVERVTGADTLYEVLAEADVVVCAAMGSEDTRGLFDAAAFAACKPGAVFVNVARGSVVDEDALLAALESGQVGAAGLDVHAREPADPSSPLLSHPRVVATPHVGGVTTTMFRRSGELFAQNLERWAAGEEPYWAVNRPPSPR
ncbi:phosphoglycerate dehydrogenase-like enzyme [Pseudonocardia sediminis]|uniref:Phosphoglycerate dehydrogenase-like enzyme n=1 Tax=Pseudonocardia sediminis TaxID=1397368 RepID=A0A4Q7UX80_PSEST|nr:NAD(P)-dependent oxidoreductase [Pseudonocardia sediminis]RZT86612.1 phosphoglycerate dehydrogenase-like enzyme [Pseudonocardia sediminis]